MKKDIYCITNKITGMEYIGQSSNAEKRFKAHSRATDGTLLHQAIRTYGIENFEMKILVPQIENFNELERFWIKEKNTIYPFGYNMTKGGEGYPHMNGELCYQAKLTNIQVKEIINLLRNTDISQQKIGELYNVRQTIISNINLGKTYYFKEEQYPIRNKKEEYEEIFLQAKCFLKNTNKSLSEIAKILDIDCSTVNAINQGKRFFHNEEQYPLRAVSIGKLGDKEILNIIKKMLEEQKLSIEEIAIFFNVQRSAISHINLGKTHFNKNWNYPLRKEYKKSSKTLSDEIVNKIIWELKNTKKSFRKIARDYNIGSHSTIQGINCGTTKAYFKKNMEYPIRK